MNCWRDQVRVMRSNRFAYTDPLNSTNVCHRNASSSNHTHNLALSDNRMIYLDKYSSSPYKYVYTKTKLHICDDYRPNIQYILRNKIMYSNLEYTQNECIRSNTHKAIQHCIAITFAYRQSRLLNPSWHNIYKCERERAHNLSIEWTSIAATPI